MGALAGFAAVVTQIEVRPSDADEDSLDHIFCCSQDVALCGVVYPGDEFSDRPYDDDEDVCVVCKDLAASDYKCSQECAFAHDR